MVHPLYGVLGAVNKRACKVPSTVFNKQFYFAYSLLPKTVAVNYKESLKVFKSDVYQCFEQILAIVSYKEAVARQGD